MESSTSTRNFVAYLKGLALTVVIANHYINLCYPGKYIFYARLTISIFFVLSGYGIYHSLSNTYKNGTNILLNTLKFYYKRAVRILPLYWISLITASFIMPEIFSFSKFILFPFINYPGKLFWFVAFILQCYLVAPLLFFIICKLKKNGYFIYLCLIFLFACGLMSLSRQQNYTKYFEIKYLGMPWGQILLFAAGMLLPRIINDFRSFCSNKLYTAVSFILFVITLLFVRHVIFTEGDIGLNRFLLLLFFGSVVAFCMFSIAANFTPLLSTPYTLIGTYSYSIYLLHWPFFKLLDKCETIDIASLPIISTVILFSPLLILFCAGIEKGLSLLIKKTNTMIGIQP
ncbi:MAG: acyltransferase [Sedimentisphaerales bacterium]|nr:acyltransferase [Sedimentisphaerales bacterium]